jgi:Leucine-rich repeat (LRR) protein
MTGNEISILNPTNFSAYPNLETLVLNDNQLTVIPTGALENLPQLTNL